MFIKLGGDDKKIIKENKKENKILKKKKINQEINGRIRRSKNI